MSEILKHHQIWGRVNCQEELNSLQDDLITLKTWSENNNIPFNVSKCKVLHLGRNNLKATYSSMGSILRETKEVFWECDNTTIIAKLRNRKFDSRKEVKWGIIFLDEYRQNFHYRIYSFYPQI